MTITTEMPPPPAARSVRARAAVAAGTAATGSVIAAEIVALVGKAAGAAHVTELMPGTLGVLTIVGVVTGTGAWTLISRRASDPGRLLAWLVPAVLALSYVPDVALGVHGTAWSAVATLMAAHAAVFAVTVPVLARLLSPASLSRDRVLPGLLPSAPGEPAESTDRPEGPQPG